MKKGKIVSGLIMFIGLILAIIGITSKDGLIFDTFFVQYDTMLILNDSVYLFIFGGYITGKMIENFTYTK